MKYLGVSFVVLCQIIICIREVYRASAHHEYLKDTHMSTDNRVGIVAINRVVIVAAIMFWQSIPVYMREVGTR